MRRRLWGAQAAGRCVVSFLFDIPEGGENVRGLDVPDRFWSQILRSEADQPALLFERCWGEPLNLLFMKELFRNYGEGVFDLGTADFPLAL